MVTIRQSRVLAAVVLACSLGSCGLFLPTAATPDVTPLGGNYPPGVVIARMSSETPGAVIHYTTDGTSPTGGSPVYPAEGLPIGQSMLVQARAMVEGARPSAVASVSYIIEDRGGSVIGRFFADPGMTVPVGDAGDFEFHVCDVDRVDETGTIHYDLELSRFLVYCDVDTGRYAVTGLPADAGFMIHAYFKRVSSVSGPHAGDLIAPGWLCQWKASEIVARGRIGLDLHAVPIIHMTGPPGQRPLHVGRRSVT